ncbi:MAG TPA: hypothetical protein VK468_04360 [Pyrinomonadaceae bacterium]|nr:hypothetical protein [Pyrinomonadaceae bacterium]
MKRYFLIFSFVFALTSICASTAAAQADDDSPTSFPGRNARRREEDLRIKEMLSKQQAEHDKKEHTELLERADEALTLSNQLEKSFESTNSLTEDDKRKLASLEKLVTKIRNGLGGDDDGEEGTPGEIKSNSLKDAFAYLQTTTTKLVDELNKTTRFSISAAAIQTSNTLIRVARFLRLRK